MLRPRFSGVLLGVVIVSIGIFFAVSTVGCGGGGGSGSGGIVAGTGLVTVHMSDPPTCIAPAGPLQSVWVTVTKVRAHLSSTAESDDGGWIDLVDLTSNPVQVDLLSQSSTECFLTTLGSTMGLPPGMYQQIRIHLLANNPANGAALPSPNHCAGTGGFNCVDQVSGGLDLLLLSSQANTGIKIPPGQIAGGGIHLVAGQAADINIDFDACRSIVLQGNGSWRLKPTLHAGEVSVNNSAISGRVVDSVTLAPIQGAVIIVAAERPDANGVDRVIAQSLANSADGTFFMCPLSPGSYDIVVTGVAAGSVAYGPTVLFTVPVGSNTGNIPIIAQTGATTSPGRLMGVVTSSDTSAMPTSADVALTALQSVPPPAGSPILVTIPALPGSTSNVTTEPGATCPANTACATYELLVPPMNPSIGLFSSGGSTFSVPAAPPVLYTVDAQAFVPDGTATPDCSPSALMTSLDGAAMPLAVTPGTTTTVATLAFVSCAPGF